MKKVLFACIIIAGLGLVSCEDSVVEELSTETFNNTDPDDEEPSGDKGGS